MSPAPYCVSRIGRERGKCLFTFAYSEGFLDICSYMYSFPAHNFHQVGPH